MARARKPFCHDCKSADCHVVALANGAQLWLCGSCEMLRLNPDTPKATVPPGLPAEWPRRGRPGKPQRERLF